MQNQFFRMSVLLLIVFCGCHVDNGDKAKSMLRTYLTERANGDVTDNNWAPVIYRQMLNRLVNSDGRYVYLHHERLGKFVVVYWFGIDENLSEIRLSKSDGTHVVASVEDYRNGNRKYLLSGEPQYYSVIFDDESSAMLVNDVQLVQPDKNKASGPKNNLTR